MARSPKVREWQQRMARFQGSGQSVTRFCRDEDISVPSFYQWRKKLQLPSTADGAKDTAAAFKAVRLLASPSVTVRLPGGTQLEVPTGDPQVLCLTIQTVIHGDAGRIAGGEAC